MKLIIAGTRTFTDYQMFKTLLHYFINVLDITEVVSGAAKGVDELGELFAQNQKLPVKIFKADWTTHGKSAGPKRNKQMAEYADALFAICINGSRGTLNMIQQAKEKGLKVYEVHLNAPNS